jgi:protein gp37
MKDSKIEWTDHTGGPYFGCSMVSPGCIHCYAMELAMTRLEPIFRKAYQKAGFTDWATRPVWGDKATRVLSKGFWEQAYTLNRAAAKSGRRMRMFPSMIDWLDEMPGGIIDQEGSILSSITVFVDFLRVVMECQNLDWLLLTKRPENFHSTMARALNIMVARPDPLEEWARAWLKGYEPANVWVGASVEDQQRVVERIPRLLKIPAKIRFLSCEPLLGPLEFSNVTKRSDAVAQLGKKALDGIHWVICGGESGSEARPMHPEWVRSMRNQCKAAGVPFFFKQWGEWIARSQYLYVGYEEITKAFLAGRKFKSAVMRREGGIDESLGEAYTSNDDDSAIVHIGKQLAGRLLDGQLHDEYPS